MLPTVDVRTSMSRISHTQSASPQAVCPTSESLKNEFGPSYTKTVSHQSSKVMAISANLSWKIEQFERLTRLYKNNKSLVSERFFSAAAPNVIWELHVYPNGKREEDSGNVSFFLRQIGLEATSESLLADFQIYVTDSNGSTMSICRDAKEFTNQQGRGKFQVGRDRLTHLIQPDGTLHLCCDVEYLPLKTTLTKQEQKIWETSPERAMAVRDTMVALYNDHTHTDVEIVINGQTFRAHRCILARASEVFSTMLNSEMGMREATEGQIKITDSTPSAVRGMLEYIYTGTIERALFEKNTRDILIIAEKYNIAQLKEECEHYISDSLSVKNFTSLVFFADTYSCDVLMEECRKFLIVNYEYITNSREWIDLKKRQLNVVNELLEKALHERLFHSNAKHTTTHFNQANLELGEPLPKRTRRAARNGSGVVYP